MAIQNIFQVRAKLLGLFAERQNQLLARREALQVSMRGAGANVCQNEVTDLARYGGRLSPEVEQSIEQAIVTPASIRATSSRTIEAVREAIDHSRSLVAIEDKATEDVAALRRELTGVKPKEQIAGANKLADQLDQLFRPKK
jgi:hypothetical protein